MSPSSTPALTEREQRPWRYSYRRDVQLGWRGELVLRPLLPVSLVNGDRGTPRLAGLVASGAELTLVSGLLAEGVQQNHRRRTAGTRDLTADYEPVGQSDRSDLHGQTLCARQRPEMSRVHIAAGPPSGTTYFRTRAGTADDQFGESAPVTDGSTDGSTALP